MAAEQLTGASVRADHTSSTAFPFPPVPPGHHLAPVALGAPGPEQKIVFVQEPDWCRTNHVSAWVHFIEDIDHTGDEFAVHVRSFLNPGRPAYTMTTAIGADPMSSDPQMRAAHVIVGDEGSVDAYLTPEMADEAADSLERLVAQLRENARTARRHNEAAAEAVAV